MREKIYRFAILGTVLALAGCAGVKPGQSPSTQFTVPIPINQAYDRALAQARYCLVTDARLPTAGGISADGGSAQVQVLADFRRTVAAQVDMKALGPQSTQVVVMMWGINVWDATAVDAMQAAIEFGVPSCTNYFPSVQQPTRKKR